MTRNSKTPATASDRLSLLALGRAPSRLRSHWRGSGFSLECLEGRILLSQGIDHQTGRSVPAIVTTAAPAPTVVHGHDDNSSPSETGAVSAAAPVAPDPTAITDSEALGSDLSTGADVGSDPSALSPGTGGSLGVDGIGYPIIPSLGPVVSGSGGPTREPSPVLLPGPEPVLVALPTTPVSTAMPAPVAVVSANPTTSTDTLVTVDPTTAPVAPSAPSTTIPSPVPATPGAPAA